MRYQRLFVLFLLFISFSSFTIDVNLITGIWVPTGTNGQLAWSETVPRNKRCFIFKENGELVVRQNIGWCGTPPVTYGNYLGTWKKASDSTIQLNYKYWGGHVDAVWKVSELTDHEMIYETTSFKRHVSR